MVEDTESNLWDCLGYNVQDSPLPAETPDHLIPVERVETPASLRLRKKRAGFYAFVSGSELERVGPVCTKSDLLVWLHLRSLQRTKGAQAWVHANPAILLSYGVQGRSYQRALVNLAKAGFIEINALPGRKAQVRLRPMGEAGP